MNASIPVMGTYFDLQCCDCIHIHNVKKRTPYLEIMSSQPFVTWSDTSDLISAPLGILFCNLIWDDSLRVGHFRICAIMTHRNCGANINELLLALADIPSLFSVSSVQPDLLTSQNYAWG
jgi:hypothetical protein